MGTGIQSLAAQWAKANNGLAGLLPLAKRDFILGEYFFGGNDASTLPNRADKTKPLTKQGAPAYNANSAVVRSSLTTGYGFKTGIVPPSTFTLLLIRKNAAIAAVPSVAGFGDAASSHHFGMMQFGANNYMLGGEGLYTLGAKRARPASGADVYFEMVTCVARDFSVGRYGAAGVLTKETSTDVAGVVTRMNNDNVTPNFKQVVFGSNELPDSIDNNSVEIFYGAIIADVFSDVEANATYQALRTLYATRGVTVV